MDPKVAAIQLDYLVESNKEILDIIEQGAAEIVVEKKAKCCGKPGEVCPCSLVVNAAQQSPQKVGLFQQLAKRKGLVPLRTSDNSIEFRPIGPASGTFQPSGLRSNLSEPTASTSGLFQPTASTSGLFHPPASAGGLFQPTASTSTFQPTDELFPPTVSTGGVFQPTACSSSEPQPTASYSCQQETIHTLQQQNKYIFSGSSCSLEDFAVAKHVMQLVSCPNTLSLLLTDFFFENAVAEFIRFMLFVEDHPEPGKSQLAYLIFPITIYLYTLMIQADDCGVDGARTFLRGPANVFRKAKSYQGIVNALLRFKDIEEFKSDKRFKDFIERKLIVKMSRDVFQNLQAFLCASKKKMGDSVLFMVLSLYVEFVDSDLDYCITDDDADKVRKSKGKSDKNSGNKGDENGKNKGDENGKNKGDENGKNKGDENEGNKGDENGGNKGDVNGGNKGDENCSADNGGIEKSNDMDPELRNIDIIKVFLDPQNNGKSLINYDLESEEMVVVDNVAEYMTVKKKEEVPKKRVVRRSRTHFTSRKASKAARASLAKKKQPEKPLLGKERKEVENPYLRSVFSVDFNSNFTELAFAIGDTFIYTLAIVAPGEEDKKVVNFTKDTTVFLRTLNFNKSNLRSTSIPESGNIYVLKYVPTDPFEDISHLLVACGLKVIMFDTKARTVLTEYNIENSHVYDLDIDPTREYFATANQYSSAYVYAFRHTARFCMLAGHDNAVTVVKFHPNGIYVATGSDDCTVRLFEIESGQCVRIFLDLYFGVTVMDFSYDGSYIAAGDTSGMVRIWNIKDCTEKSIMAWRMPEEITNVIESLCFHEKSFVLAASNQKNEVKFWDIRNPSQKQTVRCVHEILAVKRVIGKCWVLILMPSAERTHKIHFKKPRRKKQKPTTTRRVRFAL